MMQTLSIHALENPEEISRLCHEFHAPILLSNHGQNELVIMSMEHYAETLETIDILNKLGEAEQQVADGKVLAAKEVLEKIRKKYNL